MDKNIQRNVQKTIIKNKGLTRKRKRVDSNGRVKKRMKYEKMQKVRNSQVKQFKDGKQ
jgi:U3 small nucleolar RNA-associated protein 3